MHARIQGISSGEPGGGGGCPGPSATSFLSHQLNLRFFSKKTIISKTPRGGGGPIFSGGPAFPGGGGSKYKNPNNL